MSYCCPKCGKPLSASDVEGYPFVCLDCDENFYQFEAVWTENKSATAEYTWGFGVENDTLYRNGKRVGGINYSDLTDTCMWWYIDPLGFEHHDNFGDPNMTPADLQRKVMFQYEDIASIKEEA